MKLILNIFKMPSKILAFLIFLFRKTMSHLKLILFSYGLKKELEIEIDPVTLKCAVSAHVVQRSVKLLEELYGHSLWSNKIIKSVCDTSDETKWTDEELKFIMDLYDDDPCCTFRKLVMFLADNSAIDMSQLPTIREKKPNVYSVYRKTLNGNVEIFL